MMTANINFFNLKNDFIDSWYGIKVRWFRSLLSCLGISVGVISLITMVSISQGAKEQIMQKILSLGIDTIRLESRYEKMSNSNNQNLNLLRGLTLDDVNWLNQKFQNPHAISYSEPIGETQFHFNKNTSIGELIATDINWFNLENIEISSGRLFAELDFLKHNQVCVLGSKIALKLKVSKPLSIVNFNNNQCRLVGIIKSKGRMLTEGTQLTAIDFDNSVFIPFGSYPSFKKTYQKVSLITIKIAASGLQKIRQIGKVIEQDFSGSHVINVDYIAVLPIKLLEQAESEQRIFTLVMSTIAGLSLLVGGIGIMNVMLAHIAEQTREIGLRVAIGAPPNRILSLILSYSIILTFIGGIAGSILGIIFALSIQWLIGWPILISFWSLLLGFFFALGTGVIFGLYPAVKASMQEVTESLREY